MAPVRIVCLAIGRQVALLLTLETLYNTRMIEGARQQGDRRLRPGAAAWVRREVPLDRTEPLRRQLVKR